MINFLRAVVFAAVLSSSSMVLAQDPKLLVEQATAAYERKDFAVSADLFLKAADAGVDRIDNEYNAACAFALNGQADKAFKHLQSAIDAGLNGSASVRNDADFASLHGDPRWLPLLASFETANPMAPLVDELKDHKRSSASRYFLGRQALADGKVTAGDTMSLFNQYYANMAQFVGEYDEASKVYGNPKPVDDPLAKGYSQASAANEVILARSRGRQAVFLNESHGQSQTRAANYSLLAPLRAQGFKYLAIETLATTDYLAPGPGHCSNTKRQDRELDRRGYAVIDTGFYTQDPVFAEIIREALRLGYVLVAYDTKFPNTTTPMREQNQAANLACLFKDDPKARLVLIGGFSHIGEDKNFWVPGGAMAYRFKTLTGIDPLSVDRTSELWLDQSKLAFAAPVDPRIAEGYVLRNAKGEVYGTDNFDIAVYVPAPAHRNDAGGSWLELGGVRKPVLVVASQCLGHFPCLIQARRVKEQPDAVSSDRCVLASSESSCMLYLSHGSYEISAMDDQEKLLASIARTID